MSHYRHHQFHLQRPRPPLWKQVMIVLAIYAIFGLMMLAVMARHGGLSSGSYNSSISHY
jgi:hypothetical protein